MSERDFTAVARLAIRQAEAYGDEWLATGIRDLESARAELEGALHEIRKWTTSQQRVQDRIEAVLQPPPSEQGLEGEADVT